ncbi:MAG TPA: proline dehydrogenase family protein [Actinomycetota bacterium]|nr:proline dehydrogenase family protein [Actinomycetota bacterium]
MTALLRGATLWVTERPLVRRLVTEHRFGRQFALRFVAGDNLDSGMRAARALHEQGIRSMLDHLGENVGSPAQASNAADAYIHALKRIREVPEVDCDISVKLTQLGLDSSLDTCMENMERVLEAANGIGSSIQVMIDMEAHEYVDRTLDVYMALRGRYPSIGVCVQAYLYRTAADVGRIAGPQAVVRVCKGSYLEPPDIAMRSRREVRRSFAGLTATLLASGSLVHMATHDERLIQGARRFIHARAIPKERYEFQMLYGIRRDLQAALVREGEPVRVYIPYGTQWYPYLTRRMAERPANVWFFLSNALRGVRSS